MARAALRSERRESTARMTPSIVSGKKLPGLQRIAGNLVPIA
ncbi:hypothetical protein [Novosphingobium olei]|nr:hypothetical protein NSDW_20940 [Novosphingobium olei]